MKRNFVGCCPTFVTSINALKLTHLDQVIDRLDDVATVNIYIA